MHGLLTKAYKINDMIPQDYKQTLIDAVHILNNAQNEIFTAMVNVGFAGVYRDISEVHEKDEILTMELAYFENTGDVNVDTILEVVKNIFSAKHTLINLNTLKIDLDQDD